MNIPWSRTSLGVVLLLQHVVIAFADSPKLQPRPHAFERGRKLQNSLPELRTQFQSAKN